MCIRDSVNVVELAGFIVTQVLDEPVAAASALNIKYDAFGFVFNFIHNITLYLPDELPFQIKVTTRSRGESNGLDIDT